MANPINKSVLWENLVNFMEIHPDLAKGQFSGPTGREKQKQLWKELGSTLDSQGFGQKTIQKWQKTWSDFKYNLKKKAAAIQVDLNATGGGPAQTQPLSEIEERCLAILGSTFAHGSGVQELGLDSTNQNDVAPNTKRGCEELECTSYEDVVNASMPSTNIDHMYSKTSQAKKMKRGTLNQEIELCRETLQALKDIKNVMASGFQSIDKSLKELNNTLQSQKCLNCDK